MLSANHCHIGCVRRRSWYTCKELHVICVRLSLPHPDDRSPTLKRIQVLASKGESIIEFYWEFLVRGISTEGLSSQKDGDT